MSSTEAFFKERFPQLFDKPQPKAMGNISPELKAQHEKKIAASTTTILAIKCLEDAVIAADRRTSGGLYLFSDSSRKVHRLTDHSAVAYTGTKARIQDDFKEINLVCKNWDNNFYEPPSLDGQANLMSMLVKYNWEWFKASGWFDVAIPVLAGYDDKLEKPRIFHFDVAGSLGECENYCGDGCGYDYIEGILREGWKKNMDRKSGIKLAVKALFHSGKSSIGVSDSQLVSPLVATVNKNGFRWVPEKLIKEYVKDCVSSLEDNR